MKAAENKPLADTAELPALETKSTASAGAGRVRVDCAGDSHRGLVRANNEDHFMTAHFGRFLTPLSTNIRGQTGTVFQEEGYGLAVADGMGGAAAGELASELAIRTLLNLVFETPDWIISADGAEAERVMARMAERFRQIDAALVEKSQQVDHLRGMGTTLTLACNVGDSLIVVHVGDSRAYLFRAGALHQLTRDHTVAQAMVDQGILERKEQAAGRLRHTLIRLLGGIGQQCEAEVQRLTLLDGDILLLCTDGLTDMVGDAEITAILAASGTATDACQALIDAALRNGGKDNITAIVARYGFFERATSSTAGA